MRCGRVYVWEADPAVALGGRVRCELVPLPRLDRGAARGRGLRGRFVRVRNATALPAWHPAADQGQMHLSAAADDRGNFSYDPMGGGPRIDRATAVDLPAFDHYLEASRFGVVNTYYHLDRIAAYVDTLLRQLNAPPLPPVTAVVNAHSAIPRRDGITDGIRRAGEWKPFQGGHYRLPGPRSSIIELERVAADGEIHLGPGRQLLDDGALAEAAGRPYRHNASHNGAILYHEYGHHLTRHTADFMGNAQRPATLQENLKPSLEEGICDYWVATRLDSAHIWAWHRGPGVDGVHGRSLNARRTIDDFDDAPDADPHRNGTIWAAALWELRSAIGDARATDLLVLKMLLLWREVISGPLASSAALLRSRESFAAALALLLHADDVVFGSAHRTLMVDVFATRGITPDGELWPRRARQRNATAGAR